MKSRTVTLLVLLFVVILAGLILYIENIEPEVNEEHVRCIAEHSVLYSQKGCHSCETQENLFGETYKYLNVVDCLYETEVCLENEIESTPTWIINGKHYKGLQSIKELKSLTGC